MERVHQNYLYSEYPACPECIGTLKGEMVADVFPYGESLVNYCNYRCLNCGARFFGRIISTVDAIELYGEDDTGEALYEITRPAKSPSAKRPAAKARTAPAKRTAAKGASGTSKARKTATVRPGSKKAPARKRAKGARA